MTTAADYSARIESNARARAWVGWVKTLAAHGGDVAAAAREISYSNPRGPAAQMLEQRAAVAAGDIDDNLAPARSLAAAYLAVIRPRVVLDRLPRLRKAPANIKFPTQTSTTSVNWTANGSPVQASALTYETTELPPRKIAGLTVFSQELARSSDPNAETLFETDLTNSIVGFCDQQLLDPTVAAVGETSPASITYGAPSVSPSGTTAAAAKADLAELVRAMTGAGCAFAAPAWIMSPHTAINLAMMGLDPALSLVGGSLFGVPVITTTGGNTNGSSPDTELIVLVDGAAITVSDAGLDVSVSTHAAVEMTTTPSSPATASTVMTNLWQRDLVGVLVSRHINWAAAPGACGYIAGANYGA